MRPDVRSTILRLMTLVVMAGALAISGCNGDNHDLTAVTVANVQNTVGERSFTVDGAAIDEDLAGQMGTLTIGAFNMDSNGDGTPDTAAFSFMAADSVAGGTIAVGNSCTITVFFEGAAGEEVAYDPPQTAVADPCEGNATDGTLRLTVDGEVFTLTSSTVASEIFNLSVDLSPTSEVQPPVPLANRSETGTATLRLLSGDVLEYTITVNHVLEGDALTNAHIHPGGVTENGPVLITLVNQPVQLGRTTNIVFPTPSNGTVTVTGSIPLTMDEAAQLSDETNAFYVNAHSEQVPTGLVRGQLRENTVLAFNTPLSAQNEIPALTGRAETGFATLRLLADNTLVYTLTVNDLLEGDPLINAHIHMGSSTENGPVFITLVNQPVQDGRTTDIQFNGAASVTASILLTADEVAALMAPNQPLYVNIHSEQQPGGVVRGQLRDVSTANQAPTANAGQDQMFTLDMGQTTVDVTLDGSASSDPDGAIAAFTWTAATADSPDPADVDMPTVTLGPGTHTFSLVVTDDEGADSAADTVSITVGESVVMVRFATDIQPIFTQNCALSGCHIGASPPAALNLEAGQAFNNLVGVASTEMPALNRVQPGDPDASYLFKKHRGDADISGSRMPLTNPTFFDDNPDLLDLEEAWIRQGAQNN